MTWTNRSRLPRIRLSVSSSIFNQVAKYRSKSVVEPACPEPHLVILTVHFGVERDHPRYPETDPADLCLPAAGWRSGAVVVYAGESCFPGSCNAVGNYGHECRIPNQSGDMSSITRHWYSLRSMTIRVLGPLPKWSSGMGMSRYGRIGIRCYRAMRER